MNDRFRPRQNSFAERLGLQRPAASESAALNIPLVVLWVVGLTCAISIFQFLSPQRMSLMIDYRFGFVPSKLSHGLASGADSFGLALPLISHIFLHGNMGHLLLNMLLLIVFGSGVARRLKADGYPGTPGAFNIGIFVAFFVACGIAGAVAYFAREPNSMVPMVGASGAISGLMAASMRFALRTAAPYGVAHGPLLSVLSRPVMIATAAYVGINLATGMGLDLMNTGGMQVAWDAHIGGYLFGLLAFPLFDGLARKGTDPSGRIARSTFH